MNKLKFIFAGCLLISLIFVSFEAMSCTEDSDCGTGGTCLPQGICLHGGSVPQLRCKPACGEGTHCEDGTCVPDEPAEPEEPGEPEGEELVNVPELENFTLEESYYEPDYVSLTFVPKGSNPGFYVMVALSVEDGQEVAEFWCEGDETLCKAIGNGRDCIEERATGPNAWCYAGER